MKRLHMVDSWSGLTAVLASLALLLATLVQPSIQALAAAEPQNPRPAADDSAKTQSAPERRDLDENFNPPPFDFTDDFYRANGVDPEKLNTQGARFGFGSNRLTGPPAAPGQVNWVIDKSNTNPDRNNVRILASTGGYKDDTGSPTQFISIIAFMNDESFFTPQNRSGGTGNARGLAMEDIVSNFEAYAAPRQVGSDGVFRPTPCASIGDQTQVAAGNCFSIVSEETPHLRQDWRFSTNRTAIDGSAPLSYFGDNLLGLWIITYFWYTDAGFGPHQTPDCKVALDFLAARNGLTLDGTPVIKTGAELHFIEAALQGNETNAFPTPPTNACGMEGQLAHDGSDHGAVWLVCPSIPDPTHGGIAKDAFVDTVRRPDGSLIDPNISASFRCLQKNGNFCALPTGTFRVSNQASNLSWDSANPPGPASVQLAAFNNGPTATTQLWTFTAHRDGTYGIVNKATGQALTSSRSGKSSVIALGKLDGDSDERWFVTPVNNGFRITSVSSHLAVDPSADVPNTGASLVPAVQTGDTRQVWVIH